MRILLVDDERSALKDLKRIVEYAEPDAEILTAESSEEALKICKEKPAEVVFLDIQMPEKDGLTLARELKAIVSGINIVIVTGYSEYALDALKLYVSDFIVKPATLEEVQNALMHLRNPLVRDDVGFRVQCFGDFEVFFNGKAVKFGRSKAKELLAYLVDRKGAASNTNRIIAALWEDENGDKTKNHFRQVVSELRKTLKQCNVSDLLIHNRDSFSIDAKRLNCDYYKLLRNDPSAIASYRGEYMSQYAWAEFTAAEISNFGKKF